MFSKKAAQIIYPAIAATLLSVRNNLKSKIHLIHQDKNIKVVLLQLLHDRLQEHDPPILFKATDPYG